MDYINKPVEELTLDEVRELKASEERYRQIVQNANSIIIAMDTKLKNKTGEAFK